MAKRLNALGPALPSLIEDGAPIPGYRTIRAYCMVVRRAKSLPAETRYTAGNPVLVIERTRSCNAGGSHTRRARLGASRLSWFAAVEADAEILSGIFGLDIKISPPVLFRFEENFQRPTATALNKKARR